MGSLRLLDRSALRFVALASLFGVIHCDDNNAFQNSEAPGPPRLVRLMMQDEGPFGGRLIALDLLDQAAPTVCSDNRPCPLTSQFAGDLPVCRTVAGMTEGLCTDPFSGTCATPIFAPSTTVLEQGAPYDSCGMASTGARPAYLGTPQKCGGNQLRLVFSKLLDPSVEPALPQIIELDGPDGKAVPLCTKDPHSATGEYFDVQGLPDVSKNPIAGPFGPAIVLMPASPLSPNSSYTVKLAVPKVIDRKGQAAVAADGSALPSSFTFVTEQPSAVTSAPDVIPWHEPAVATLHADDVLQFTLNTGVDPASGSFTLRCAGKAIPVEAWRDNGASASACSPDSRTIDLVAVSAPGKPADLPAGACTLIVDGVKSDDAFKKGTWTATFAFNVDGTKDAADPFAVTAYVLPEQCGTTMMMPDAAGPLDAAASRDASTPIDLGFID